MILGSIVLAGGDSSRMGSPKASLPWRDGSLLLHSITTLLDCSYPVIAVAQPDQELPPMHTESEIAFDDQPGEGPLTAIATGIRATEGRCGAVLVVGCDQPFVTDITVGWLSEQLGEHRGVVPEVDGQLYPLCAIYRVELLAEIEKLIAGDERRALALAELPGVEKLSADRLREHDPELKFLRDVDTPEAYEAAKRDDGQG